MALQYFPLPLPSQVPFGSYPHSVSQDSNTIAFNTGLDSRDRLASSRRCIVCGRTTALNRAHIIPRDDDETWKDLQHRGYIPNSAKSVLHEPRNAITLCACHHIDFDDLRYFIRYIKETNIFVFINFSQNPSDEEYHGKKVLLDPANPLSPFPAIFLLHEWRVRARWPFLSDREISEVSDYPAWPQAPLTNPNSRDCQSTIPHSPFTSTNKPPGSGDNGRDTNFGMSLNQVERILTATRELPTWNACIIDGTSWEGTTEENIAKYREIMSV